MPRLVEGMLRRFAARQEHFFEKLSKEQKRKFRELENKYAILTVTGPEGGVFYLQYKGGRFEPLGQKPDIDYDELDKFLLDGDGLNYPSGDEVFFDVVDGDLTPEKVIAHQYFRANTDRIIYDTYEIRQAFKEFLEEMRVVLRGKNRKGG